MLLAWVVSFSHPLPQRVPPQGAFLLSTQLSLLVVGVKGEVVSLAVAVTGEVVSLAVAVKGEELR